MSNLMRKEFEAACEARFNWATQYQYRDESESALSAWNGESYRSRIVQSMWWAWQASRERLVIELPIPVDFPDGTGDYHQMIDPDDLIDAIHAAGVKTK